MSDDSSQEDSQKPEVDDATRYVGGEGSASDEFDLDDFDLHIDEDDSESDGPGLVGMVGEYLLLDQIGVGGMGQVFRAEHRTMNREVALKVLSKEIADRPNILQQFFSEIRAVAKLMHPNIVTAFDAGSSGAIHYLVMELVNGEVLSDRVKRDGPLSAEEAINVLEQAAKALGYAHELGIVHRDIKPSNMMLTTAGVVKILDFGLARISTASSESEEGKKKYFMGTPEYMSPEQIENADSVDGRADLYSLGSSFHYLLTGKAMFTGERMQVAKAHLHEKPKPLFEIRGDLDLRLDSVFQRLVAKTLEQRYENAQELLEHLEELELTSEMASGASLRKGAYRLAKDSPTSAGHGMSTLAKKSQIVGIDLGMLTTTAAHYDPNTGPQIISQGEGNPLYLRNMVWSSGRSIRIGAEASALRQVDPEKIFHSVQRWIGQQEIQRPFGGKNVPPEVILAAMLRRVMDNSANVTDNSGSAIITVPACYDQMHRRAIRNACRIAGIELVQLLSKPAAAALTWLEVNCRLSDSRQVQRAADERLLVIQLSGTGLDASVLHAHGTTIKQLGTCGHWQLGQQRWQHLLVQYFAETLKEKTGKRIKKDVAAATRLQRTVEIAMNQLTTSSKVEVRFDWLGTSIQQMITQNGLTKIAPDLTLSLQQSIATACAIAKLDLAEIDRVLLAGSMMQMKVIQNIVTDVIPHDVEVTWMEKADLARGAAIQANSISSFERKHAILPQAVGGAAYDLALLAESPDSVKQRPKVLIEKGKPLPTSHARTIRPKVKDGQCSALPALQLIESSSLGTGNWLKLGRVDPASAFPQRKPDEALQLRLEVDESGILESSLVLANSNERIPLPATSDPEMTPGEIDGWREWLDAALNSPAN